MSNKNDEQNSAEVDLRTPEEWCQIERVQVLDADGWRGRDGRPWIDPISLAEFQQRLVSCTQRSIPLPAPNTRRLAPCVKNWPDCESGEYNPACCRFPKSCSCTSYNPDTIKDEDLEPMTTHPAGEHHTGTLDLTGEGNAPGSPISDETVHLAERAYEAFGAGMQDALDAAYLAIRQQVADEIAGRERVLAILNAHRMHYAYGDDAACLCGWAPTHMRAWHDEHRDHTADMIAAGIAERS